LGRQPGGPDKRQRSDPNVGKKDHKVWRIVNSRIEVRNLKTMIEFCGAQKTILRTESLSLGGGRSGVLGYLLGSHKLENGTIKKRTPTPA